MSRRLQEKNAPGHDSFEVVAQRLKVALKIKNDLHLAAALGMKSSAFYNRKSGGSIPYGPFIELARKNSVSIDWLFFGLGTPFRDSSKEAPAVAALDIKLWQEICGQLEAVLAGPGVSLQQRRKARDDGALRGGLAAALYPKVAFIRNDRLRSSVILKEAEGMAHAVRIAIEAGIVPQEPSARAASRKKQPVQLKNRRRGGAK